jgi:hypothetical protein
LSSIPFSIPDELNGILNTFEYIKDDRLIKLQFSEVFKNKLIFSPFNVRELVKSLSGLERKVKSIVTGITKQQYNLIETCIYQELDKLKQETENNSGGNITIEKVQQVRKFKLDDKTFESILVDNEPYFITTTGEESMFKLENQIEVSGNTFLPADNITTINPLPYSFESEDELKHYLEKAKRETFDTLFIKVLTEFKRYVSVDEHVSTILSADIIYSYFQDRFGTTHYNIFIGENGSGKNSALLVFKYLGYRVFYVTAASAANYYTFLGDIQEGQGTIAEDEADDIGEDKVKQRILKTGYASGGTVPKVEFSRNGTRSQKPYLTFCHKWLAMEEIPDERKIRGVLDRSFIFKFLAGEVEHNIKGVEKDENTELYDKIIDLRKTLFAFKFLHQSDRFEDVTINIKNRNAELTKPLLRLFKNSEAQEQIRKALAVLIKEKSQIKSNSTEAKIFEALNDLISQSSDENKEVYQFTNDQIFEGVKRTMDGLENQFDGTYSTFITPDGLYVSKKKIKQILVSKFNAVADRVKIGNRAERVIRISKKWLDKLGKQYEVIEGIDFISPDNQDGFCDGDTMTDVTLLESATPHFDKEFGDKVNKEDDNNNQADIDKTDGNLDTRFTRVDQLEEHSETDANCDPKAKLSSDLNDDECKENQEEEGTRMGLAGPFADTNKDINDDLSIIKDTNNQTNRISTDNSKYNPKLNLSSNLNNLEVNPEEGTRMGPADPSGSILGNNEFQNNETYNELKTDKDQSDKFQDNNSSIEQDNQSTKNTQNMGQALPESVTSVTSVTKKPYLPFYFHCHYCPDFSAESEDEVDSHKLEKHKRELLKYYRVGGLTIREQLLAEQIQMTMKETSRILDIDDV